MPGKKDFFGIASRGFNHDLKYSREDRNSDGDSLYDQLEKNGTPEEKAAIRKIKASSKVGSNLVSKPRFTINAWK